MIKIFFEKLLWCIPLVSLRPLREGDRIPQGQRFIDLKFEGSLISASFLVNSDVRAHHEEVSGLCDRFLHSFPYKKEMGQLELEYRLMGFDEILGTSYLQFLDVLHQVLVAIKVDVPLNDLWQNRVKLNPESLFLAEQLKKLVYTKVPLSGLPDNIPSGAASDCYQVLAAKCFEADIYRLYYLIFNLCIHGDHDVNHMRFESFRKMKELLEDDLLKKVFMGKENFSKNVVEVGDEVVDCDIRWQRFPETKRQLSSLTMMGYLLEKDPVLLEFLSEKTLRKREERGRIEEGRDRIEEERKRERERQKEEQKEKERRAREEAERKQIEKERKARKEASWEQKEGDIVTDSSKDSVRDTEEMTDQIDSIVLSQCHLLDRSQADEAAKMYRDFLEAVFCHKNLAHLEEFLKQIPGRVKKIKPKEGDKVNYKKEWLSLSEAYQRTSQDVCKLMGGERAFHGNFRILGDFPMDLSSRESCKKWWLYSVLLCLRLHARENTLDSEEAISLIKEDSTGVLRLYKQCLEEKYEKDQGHANKGDQRGKMPKKSSVIMMVDELEAYQKAGGLREKKGTRPLFLKALNKAWGAFGRPSPIHEEVKTNVWVEEKTEEETGEREFVKAKEEESFLKKGEIGFQEPVESIKERSRIREVLWDQTQKSVKLFSKTLAEDVLLKKEAVEGGIAEEKGVGISLKKPRKKIPKNPKKDRAFMTLEEKEIEKVREDIIIEARTFCENQNDKKRYFKEQIKHVREQLEVRCKGKRLKELRRDLSFRKRVVFPCFMGRSEENGKKLIFLPPKNLGTLAVINLVDCGGHSLFPYRRSYSVSTHRTSMFA